MRCLPLCAVFCSYEEILYKEADACHFFILIYADSKAANMVIVMKIFKNSNCNSKLQ